MADQKVYRRFEGLTRALEQRAADGATTPSGIVAEALRRHLGLPR